MLKNVTVTLPEDLVMWARKKAADENCSVSKLLCKLIENARSQGDASKQMHLEWKKRKFLAIDAGERMTREEMHELR